MNERWIIVFTTYGGIFIINFTMKQVKFIVYQGIELKKWGEKNTATKGENIKLNFWLPHQNSCFQPTQIFST